MDGEDLEGRDHPLRIPDTDLNEWLAVYYACGFSDEEVNGFMLILNDTWAERLLRRFIDDEVGQMERKMKELFGTPLTDTNRMRTRAMVFRRLRRVPYRDLERGARYPFVSPQRFHKPP